MQKTTALFMNCRTNPCEIVRYINTLVIFIHVMCEHFLDFTIYVFTCVLDVNHNNFKERIA